MYGLPLPLLLRADSRQFSNLLGTVYCSGNLVFTPDGNSLLSPVGNKVTCFDLVKSVVPPQQFAWTGLN